MVNDPAFIGWVLGLCGGAIGVAGGLLGTYASIRNTQNARERAFVIRASAILWAAITVFLLMMFLVPEPYRAFLWIPYALASEPDLCRIQTATDLPHLGPAA